MELFIDTDLLVTFFWFAIQEMKVLIVKYFGDGAWYYGKG